MLRKGKTRGPAKARPAISTNNRQWHGLPERSLLASAVASCLMMGAPAALGQSANANLRGQVATATAGTEVTATNVANGVVRRTQTNADGSYVLVGLQPGTYVVESGGSRDTITLSVASNATLNLEAGAAGDEAIEQITVYGQQTSGFDVYTSEVGGTISPREIAQLPQATRNFLEFADTVPGMRFETDAQGTTSLSGGATSSNLGNLYIDGVGQKSYVQAGGIAGQNFTRGNPFPQLAIGQYKVITSNYKAEYGQVAGAAVTAVTRSGTNEFEADAYFRYTDQDLRDERPDEKAPGVEKVDSKTEEYGFAVAGPIIQDRLHYILAYEYKDLITPRSVTPDPNAESFVQYLPADVQALYGPQDVPFEEDLLFGKLSWNFTDSDLLELSLQYRDEVQVDSIGGRRAAGHGRDVINKDERATLRWEHNSSNWFNELLFTTEDSENNPFPQGIGNGLIYSQLNRLPTGEFANEWVLIEAGPSSGFDAQARKQDGWSIANNFTLFGLDWYGDHTLKFGVSYKDIQLTAQDAGAINPQFRYEVTPAGVEPTPYRVNFLAPFNVPGQRATVVTDSKQYGFYLQDDWAIGDQLILNVGIRYDYEENPAYTDFVTSQAFVDALYADDPDIDGVQPWADRLLPSGLNAADFVSTGGNRDDFDGAWAPRIGFSYDVNADAQYIVHGGAGRFYDRNLFSILSLEVSKAALSPVEIHFQDPGTGECYQGVTGRPCVPWDQAYFDQGIDALVNIPVTAGNAELFMLNNNLETPYTDQFSLGLTTQLGEWQTDVTVQQINAKNGFIFTLINRYPDGSFFDTNGSQPWGEPVPGYANTILGNNGIESENTQILISASKPYTSDSGWSATFAYTNTNAEHNRKLDDNFAFDKATIDQYPFIDANDVPEHRFVASGSIDGPWGMTFGAKLVLETPRPLNEIRNIGVIGSDGSFSQPISVEPPGTGSFIIGGDIWGYRTVDLQATKEFRVGDYGFTARVNLLNAFDYENYSSFNVVGPNGEFPTVEVNEFGDAYYIPRTINFELGFNF